MWWRLVDTSVSGRPLAATRILYAFAALAMLQGSRHRFDRGFDADRLHISWPLIGDRLEGLPPELVAAVWGLGALVLLTGVAARAGAAAVVVAMAAFYGVDQQHYANGGYFLILIGVLLVVADPGASRTPWGPDRRRVAWWPTFLLAAQLSIVYLYAAVQKLRRSSLDGSTIEWQLTGPVVERLEWDVLPVALNALGGAAEVFCAVALWFAVSRRAAVAVGLVLHVGVLAFIRPTADLLAFGVASVALYPAFWAAAPPIAEAAAERRSGRSAASASPGHEVSRASR